MVTPETLHRGFCKHQMFLAEMNSHLRLPPVCNETPGHIIACEINVSSTIDYEVGNVSKCLKAGLVVVAVICPTADRLSRLAEAMKCFGPEELSKIGFFSPDEFIAHLQKAKLEQTPDPSQAGATETRRRGRKVTRHFESSLPRMRKLARTAP